MEPEYRQLLLEEPDKAIEGYELTEEEVASLKSLHAEKFDAVAGELEERISRAGGLRSFLGGKPGSFDIEALTWPDVTVP
jgi:hypothetical protein